MKNEQPNKINKTERLEAVLKSIVDAGTNVQLVKDIKDRVRVFQERIVPSKMAPDHIMREHIDPQFSIGASSKVAMWEKDAIARFSNVYKTKDAFKIGEEVIPEPTDLLRVHQFYYVATFNHYDNSKLVTKHWLVREDGKGCSYEKVKKFHEVFPPESPKDVLMKDMENRKFKKRRGLAKPKPGGNGGVLGYSPAAILRWMGSQGWNFREAKKVITALGGNVKDGTISCQLHGWKTRGDVPNLSITEIAILVNESMKP